jgi:hypothetical protein
VLKAADKSSYKHLVKPVNTMTSKPTSTSEFKKSLFRFGQMMRQEVGISKNHAKGIARTFSLLTSRR